MSPEGMIVVDDGRILGGARYTPSPGGALISTGTGNNCERSIQTSLDATRVRELLESVLRLIEAHQQAREVTRNMLRALPDDLSAVQMSTVLFVLDQVEKAERMLDGAVAEIMILQRGG